MTYVALYTTTYPYIHLYNPVYRAGAPLARSVQLSAHQALRPDLNTCKGVI